MKYTVQSKSRIGISILAGLIVGSSLAVAGPYEFSTKIQGYGPSCASKASLFIKDGADWKKVLNQLPGKRMHYLDDKFQEGGAYCDFITCKLLPRTCTVPLVEYRRVQDKRAPVGRQGEESNLLIPAYRTVLLRGEIKIDIEYYDDKDCRNKRIFSTIITT